VRREGRNGWVYSNCNKGPSERRTRGIPKRERVCRGKSGKKKNEPINKTVPWSVLKEIGEK